MAIPKSNWKQGESRHYKVSKSKVRTKDELDVARDTKIKYLEIEVMESSEDYYVLEWSEFDETTNRFKRFIENSLGFRLHDTFNITYKTNKNGALEEIIDADELERQVAVARKVMLESNPAGKKIDQLLSKDLIIARLLTKINIFHLPYDIEFSEETEMVEREFQNHLMRGNNLPGQVTYSLIYIDQDSQIGEFEIKKQYQQTALNEKINETIVNIGERLGKESKEEKLPPFSITERFWYKFDFARGWILKGKYEKGYLIQGQDTIEEIVFEMIK